MAKVEEREYIFPDVTCPTCGVSEEKAIRVKAKRIDANGHEVEVEEAVDLRWFEEREFIIGNGNLRVIPEILLGRNEALYRPGGIPVENGVQEICVGIKRVEYRVHQAQPKIDGLAQVDGPTEAPDPEWSDLSIVDLPRIMAEHKQMKAKYRKLESQINVYKKQLATHGIPDVYSEDKSNATG